MIPRIEPPKFFSGRIVDGSHCLNIRVYYEDTDFTGIVYHASHIRFMERGRSDFLRLLGVEHKNFSDCNSGESLVFAVRNLSIEYLRPAMVDDVLQVWTQCTETTGTRVEIKQDIYRGSVKLSSGRVSIVILNKEGKPRRIPNEIKNLFKLESGVKKGQKKL